MRWRARFGNGKAARRGRIYPLAIFDALRVKIRDAGSRTVRNKAACATLGVTRDGSREGPG